MAADRFTTSASARIVRAMGVFSGVRIVSILCSLVRNKVLAVLVGPAGMGLVILFNSIVDMVAQSTRLSIDQSAQRSISQASAAQTNVIIAVVRRWSLWLGLLGSAVMVVLSPLFSLWSFDTTDKWHLFCLLAVVPFCLTVSSAIGAQNQGLRRFKALASSGIATSLVGLVVSVALIAWLRIDSIVWVIVVYGLSSLGGALLYRPRIPRTVVDRETVIRKGRNFIRLGAQITVAWFFAQLTSYLFVLYLNDFDSTSVLGVYQAGYALMNSYVGIVFTALFVEYYPRLSANAHSPSRLSLTATHELRLTLVLLTPLLCLLILLAHPVIHIIYSADFDAIVPYVVAACTGIVFRASSWCLAYVILAAGDGRSYLASEIVSSLVGLVLNVVGFRFGGFLGLGLAYVAWYAVYTLIVALICKYRLGVRYSHSAWMFTAVAATIVALVGWLYL